MIIKTEKDWKHYEEYETPKTLKVGDYILVELDEDNVYSGEWAKTKVTAISIQHNFRPKGMLDPYICVTVDHPTLHCFNYGMYCDNSHVKLITEAE